MLSIENYSFGYRKKSPVLKNINLKLEPGVTFLVGENGSGKTTLMNSITGTLRGEGRISIDGVDCGSAEYARMISYLPQRFDVYPMLRVREILMFVGGMKGISKDALAGEVASAAEKTNISSFMNTVFRKCSEGMQRRVGIAAALLGNPKMVILDEPTAGIDPYERFRFYSNIKDCFAGKTVLISTHILDDIESLADTVVMLTGGRIACDLPYRDFIGSLGREASLNELWEHYRGVHHEME